MITQPTPAQIAAAREAAQLTQQQAGELVHTDNRTWRRWEAGDRAINLASWELFLLKTKQIPPVAEFFGIHPL